MVTKPPAPLRPPTFDMSPSCSAAYALSALTIVAAPAVPSDHLAALIRPVIMGVRTAARMATIRMTTISSISVKALFFLIFITFRKRSNELDLGLLRNHSVALLQTLTGEISLSATHSLTLPCYTSFPSLRRCARILSRDALQGSVAHSPETSSLSCPLFIFRRSPSHQPSRRWACKVPGGRRGRSRRRARSSPIPGC